MALPEDPAHANLTPTPIRQGIRRLEIRRAEIEQFEFGPGLDLFNADDFERFRSAAKSLP